MSQAAGPSTQGERALKILRKARKRQRQQADLSDEEEAPIQRPLKKKRVKFVADMPDSGHGDIADLGESAKPKVSRSIPESVGEPGKSFGDALAAILSKPLPVSKQAAPILAKRVITADRKRKEERLKKKQEQEGLLQRRLLANKDHVIPDSATSPLEKRLLTLGTKGVVKLFNAIAKQQKLMAAEQKKQKGVQNKTSESLTKEKFLELLKQTKTTEGQQRKQSLLQGWQEKEQTPVSQANSSAPRGDRTRQGKQLKDWDKEDEDDEETALGRVAGSEKEEDNSDDSDIAKDFEGEYELEDEDEEPEVEEEEIRD